MNHFGNCKVSKGRLSCWFNIDFTWASTNVVKTSSLPFKKLSLMFPSYSKNASQFWTESMLTVSVSRISIVFPNKIDFRNYFSDLTFLLIFFCFLISLSGIKLWYKVDPEYLESKPYLDLREVRGQIQNSKNQPLWKADDKERSLLSSLVPDKIIEFFFWSLSLVKFGCFFLFADLFFFGLNF